MGDLVKGTVTKIASFGAFEALRPSSDLVGLDEAFRFAQEEYRPSQSGDSAE